MFTEMNPWALDMCVTWTVTCVFVLLTYGPYSLIIRATKKRCSTSNRGTNRVSPYLEGFSNN